MSPIRKQTNRWTNKNGTNWNRCVIEQMNRQIQIQIDNGIDKQKHIERHCFQTLGWHQAEQMCH